MKSLFFIYFCFIMGNASAQAMELALLVKNYTTPAPQELAPFATFEISDLDVTIDSSFRMNYSLPGDLDGGKRTPIHLIGPAVPDASGFYLLKGDLGRAACSIGEKELLCMINYNRENLFGSDAKKSLQKIQLYLDQVYANDAHLAERKQIAERFGNEPGGVVHAKIQTSP